MYSFSIVSTAQDPEGPPPGGQFPTGRQQMQQTPDVLISVGTQNIDLIYRVNSRDGRLYQAYLKDNQSHIFIDYVKGLYSVLEKLRTKYPDIPIMLCPGEGGRVDYGALKYFTEFWASDNTDALERVCMQWGYSYFFPAISVCNHVTSMGSQSIKFRTDVAMMGKLVTISALVNFRKTN